MRKLFVIAVSLLLGSSGQLRAALANGIEAVVDDSVITYHEVNNKNPELYDRIINDITSSRDTVERKLNEMRQDNLQLLIKNQLILHDFKVQGYALPDSVLDDIVNERVRSRFHDRATLTKSLQEEGLTNEKFRQQIKEQFILEAMRSKNISSEIVISPHKVESYYIAHRDNYKVEDEIKLRGIVLKATGEATAPPSELAEEILTKLKEGAAFEQMAALYSQDNHRKEGGAWPWYARSALLKGFADIVFELPVGKRSNVFCRSAGDDYWVCIYDDGRPNLARHYGIDPATRKQKMVEEKKIDDDFSITNLPAAYEYYILQVDDTRPSHFKTLNEVRKEIEDNLLDAEKSRLEKQYIEKLRKKTFVRTVF
jgi:peptidyl-prolyl cis-trans isomerase SurA